MPIYRIPVTVSAAAAGGGVRDGSLVQHADQSTLAQQQKQPAVQQRQVLQLRAAIVSLYSAGIDMKHGQRNLSSRCHCWQDLQQGTSDFDPYSSPLELSRVGGVY